MSFCSAFQLKQCPKDAIPCTLGPKKCIIWKKYHRGSQGIHGAFLLRLSVVDRVDCPERIAKLNGTPKKFFPNRGQISVKIHSFYSVITKFTDTTLDKSAFFSSNILKGKSTLSVAFNFAGRSR